MGSSDPDPYADIIRNEWQRKMNEQEQERQKKEAKKKS